MDNSEAGFISTFGQLGLRETVHLSFENLFLMYEAEGFLVRIFGNISCELF